MPYQHFSPLNRDRAKKILKSRTRKQQMFTRVPSLEHVLLDMVPMEPGDQSHNSTCTYQNVIILELLVLIAPNTFTNSFSPTLSLK